ncbi:MAG: RNA methyltransferase [Phycisphaerales bacterium]
MHGASITIEDEHDARIADYLDVRERDLAGPSSRPGLFVGESAIVVDRMLAIGGITKSVFVEERHAEAMRSRMDATGHGGVPLFVAPDSVLRKVAGFNVHRGVLAIGLRPARDRMTLDAAVPRRDGAVIVVAEDITNVDNVGALYRNAAAFGVDAVVLSPRCHDHLYRKSLRVSMGHALRVPTARSTDWPADLERLRGEFGFTLIVATPDSDAPVLADCVPPARTALLVGSEFSGVDPGTLARADRRVRIPMSPGGDSLNVATAAAICLYHLTREKIAR